MLCPVCKTENDVNYICTECGFDDFRTEFLNTAEANLWRKSVVMPYFEQYCLRFGCQVKGRRVYRCTQNSKEVKIPNGVEGFNVHAFRGERNVEKIILPDSIKEISGTFSYLPRLKEMHIPKKAEHIQFNFHSRCGVHVIAEKGSPYYGNGDYLIDERNSELVWLYPNSEFPVSEKIKIIGLYSLENLKIPEDGVIVIPEGVEEISDKAVGAFGKYNKIKGIILPKTLFKIGKQALSGLKFTSIELPDNLSSIGDYAFYNTNIQKIYLHENITYIGKNICGNCRNLETINVSRKNPKYYSINNCVIEKSTGFIISTCKTSSIPEIETIVGIASGAFYRFGGTNIYIPKNITQISDSAFDETFDVKVQVDSENKRYYSENNCIIEKIGKGKIVFGNDLSEIPINVDSIGTNAFSNREKNIIIPTNIINIESNIFSWSMELAEDADGNPNAFGCVFCEAESKPDGWSDDWLGNSAAKVFWKNEWTYFFGVPVPVKL